MAKYKNIGADAPIKKSSLYVYFENGKEKILTLSGWDATKNPSGYLFKGYVTKEDGNAVDKIWVIWDYEAAQQIKKLIKGKKAYDSIDLRVTAHKNEEETSYEIKGI